MVPEERFAHPDSLVDEAVGPGDPLGLRAERGLGRRAHILDLSLGAEHHQVESVLKLHVIGGYFRLDIAPDRGLIIVKSAWFFARYDTAKLARQLHGRLRISSVTGRTDRGKTNPEYFYHNIPYRVAHGAGCAGAVAPDQSGLIKAGTVAPLPRPSAHQQ